MEDQLVEAWNIHNRIQIYVLSSLSEQSLLFSADSNHKGRSVADHFMHMHNVRLMWLKASAPLLLDGLVKLEKAAEPVQKTIIEGLQASGAAIAVLIGESLAAGGKVKGFKPNVMAFYGYLVSHDSYHMGKIDLILRQSGQPMDDKTHYGMWEWGSR